MNKLRSAIIFGAFSLLFFRPGFGQDSSGVIPLGNNEFDFLYDRLERFNAMTLDKFDQQLGPYRFDRLATMPGFLSNIKNVNGEKLVIFGSIAEDARIRKDSIPFGYESYRGGLAARPVKNFFVYGNFVLDQRRAEDPTYKGKKWRGLAGDIEQAFVNFQTDHFNLMAGRFGSFWGPRHSLLLGPSARMDGLGYTYRWGRLSLTYRLAYLDGVYPPSDSAGVVVNRYWAGHRLDVHLSDRIRVGIFEAIVWGGAGRQLEFAYLNPLLSFHTFQLNRGPNDNSFVGIDFDYKPKLGLDLYGQLLIDDFQIDKKTQGDQKPNLYGVLGGFYWSNLAEGWDLSGEYSRVINRTYNQFFTWNRFLYEGHLISAALGDDYDVTSVSAYRWFGEKIRSSFNLSFSRQGEGAPSDAWTTPWLDITGPYHEAFPTGVVQRTLSASMGLKGYVTDFLYLDGHAGIEKILNFSHISWVDRTEPFVEITISLFGSKMLNLQ